jgi:hypothetical protein
MIRQLTSDIYSFIWDDKPAISVPTWHICCPDYVSYYQSKSHLFFLN